MAGESRREKIEQMLQDEPSDVFLRYSLALEMHRDNEITGCIQLLDQLTLESPPYIPAFFRCGQILADEQEIDRARTFLRRGIEAARMQHDLHAAGEMGELLAELGQCEE